MENPTHGGQEGWIVVWLGIKMENEGVDVSWRLKGSRGEGRENSKLIEGQDEDGVLK